MNAATRLFAEQGYDATSMETVQRATGLSRGALYHHFPSKGALFEAVYVAAQGRVAREVVAEAMGGATPRDKLRRGARAWLERVRDPVVRQITLIDAPGVLGWEKWRAIDQGHFLGSLSRVVEQAVGDDTPPERVDMISHMLLAALGEAAMVMARGDYSSESIASHAATIDEFVARLLGPEVE